jgi:hypothetical protein
MWPHDNDAIPCSRAAPNPSIASRLDSGHNWRGVGEPGQGKAP